MKRTKNNGVPQGYTRMTFVISHEQLEQLHSVAYFDRLTIKQIMELAIADYMAKQPESVKNGAIRAKLT
jgi:hypothetical protein